MNFALMLDGLLADPDVQDMDADVENLEAEAEALVGDCALVSRIQSLQEQDQESAAE